MQPGSQAWLDQVVEDVIEPERAIIDPHHHLWDRPGVSTYGLSELWADTSSGHRIEKTVFIECRAFYRSEGPEHLRVVGETERVAEIAVESHRSGEGRAVIAGIVPTANLTALDALDEVLDAHELAAGGLLRGIRHAGAHEPNPEALSIPGRGLPGQYAREDFREGVRRLGKRGLSYDTWHYHHQNRAFAELARAVPETTLILDHFGTPLGVGPYAGKRAEIFAQWKLDIAEIARCPNVLAKLGGLAMPDCGFAWDKRDRPASSDELLEAQRAYYLHTIDCFGPERCMFESNFPVDKMGTGWVQLWNAFKRIAAGASPEEKAALFAGTARRAYRLETP